MDFEHWPTRSTTTTEQRSPHDIWDLCPETAEDFRKRFEEVVVWMVNQQHSHYAHISINSKIVDDRLIFQPSLTDRDRKCECGCLSRMPKLPPVSLHMPPYR